MEAERETNRPVEVPRGGGRFSLAHLAIWMAVCPAVAAAAAVIASAVQPRFAPLVVFPLLVGLAVGAMLGGAMRIAQVGNRPTLLAGTLLAVAIVVVAQHYVAFRAAREACLRDVQSYRSAVAAYPGHVLGPRPAPPENLLAFLRHEAQRGRQIGSWRASGSAVWASWAIDALLTLGAATGLVVLGLRGPYCNRCRSWYRVTRGNRIDAETARQLGRAAGISVVDEGTVAWCRFRCCNGGCGPTCFVLSWKKTGGGVGSGQAWVDAEQRDRLMHLLDTNRKAGDA